jgi:hypothetical protein
MGNPAIAGGFLSFLILSSSSVWSVVSWSVPSVVGFLPREGLEGREAATPQAGRNPRKARFFCRAARQKNAPSFFFFVRVFCPCFRCGPWFLFARFPCFYLFFVF